jgi:hypothetical protein
MAILFTAQNNKIQMSNINPLPIANQITIMAWLDPTASGNYHVVGQSSSTTTSDFSLQITSGSAFIGRININNTVRTITCNANDNFVSSDRGRQHICMTYNGSQLIIYVNGIASTTASYTGNITLSSNNFTINAPGGGSNNNGDYRGYVDDIRVYSRSLTAKEVLEIAVAKGQDRLYDGLLAWYKLDEQATAVGIPLNSSGYIKDHSSFNRDGTLVAGSCAYADTWLNPFTNSFLRNNKPLTPVPGRNVISETNSNNLTLTPGTIIPVITVDPALSSVTNGEMSYSLSMSSNFSTSCTVSVTVNDVQQYTRTWTGVVSENRYTDTVPVGPSWGVVPGSRIVMNCKEVSANSSVILTVNGATSATAMLIAGT